MTPRRLALWAAAAAFGLLSGCQSCDRCSCCGERPSLLTRLGLRCRPRPAVHQGALIGGPVVGTPVSGGECNGLVPGDGPVLTGPPPMAGVPPMTTVPPPGMLPAPTPIPGAPPLATPPGTGAPPLATPTPATPSSRARVGG